MAATYRIRITRDPHSTLYAYDATIYRVADDRYMARVSAATPEEAELAAVAWVKAENAPGEPDRELLVNEQGEPAAPLHAVRTPGPTVPARPLSERPWSVRV